MCGLFGWQLAGRVPATLPIANGILCQCMSLRGDDAWGVLANGRVSKGLNCITRAPFVRKLGTLASVAAHTRYGTTGANTKANAHPFQVGGITGMHNGIISDHWALNDEFDRLATVDSQHIFMHLAEGKPLSDLTGYGAIVYARADSPGALFMGRFNGGELSVARISDAAGPLGLMWASTLPALRAAINLAGFNASYLAIEEGKTYRASGGDLYATTLPLDISQRAKPAALPGWAPSKWLSLTEDDDDTEVCESCEDTTDACVCGLACNCSPCLRRDIDYSRGTRR